MRRVFRVVWPWLFRLWCLAKILVYSLCFVVGIAVVLLSMAIMAVSVVRQVLPRT